MPACAVEMHIDRHVTRAISCENLRGKCWGPKLKDYVLCKPALPKCTWTSRKTHLGTGHQWMVVKPRVALACGMGGVVAVCCQLRLGKGSVSGSGVGGGGALQARGLKSRRWSAKCAQPRMQLGWRVALEGGSGRHPRAVNAGSCPCRTGKMPVQRCPKAAGATMVSMSWLQHLHTCGSWSGTPGGEGRI